MQSDRDADAGSRVASADESPGIDALDEHLPDSSVDSRWWYWIAAVPLYFLLSTIVGVAFFAIAILGFATDLGALTLFVFAGVFLLVALPGLLLSVLFPLAVYLDARAVAEADLEWSPDPALYGLLAVAAVLVSAFTLGVPLALYYLYRRHQHLGVP
jgi:hypothetical protein